MENAVADRKKVDEEFLGLIRQYQASKDLNLRNDILLHYSYIARTVALQMRGISANYAQLEDMVNQGILTLMDCIDRFDPDKGIKFESYAFMRVRGATIDFVRKQDWLPRRVRVASKNITAAHDALCNELLREPTQQELAQRLGMSMETLNKHYSEISNSVMLSFEVIIQNITQMGDVLESAQDSELGPEAKVYYDEMHQTLRNAIESLTERERKVVTLYYYEDLKLSDLAKILGVSDQRISQILSKAVQKLRFQMEKYMKG